MFFSGLSRVYTGFVSPPAVEKHDDAIRFGLLGASAIALVYLTSHSHGNKN